MVRSCALRPGTGRGPPSRRLLAEARPAGLLARLNLTNTYDPLGRRTNLALNLQPSAYGVSYAYDAASRLHTVTSGPDTAEYSYLANSSLVGQIAFGHQGTNRMTTTKQYDQLNRLTQVRTLGASPFPLASFQYSYNDASQRERAGQADGSFWRYEYDSLGQVKSGKKYWQDGTPVAGEQFEYNFDDIGNRKQTQAGGDASGTGLRPAAYANNLLNQITGRDVPGAADITGIAHPNATVTVNGQSPYRKGEYYRQELFFNNLTNVVFTTITNTAVLSGATSNATGRVLLAKTPETFAYDSDGNLTQDGLWNYTWDAENRLVRMVSRTNGLSESWRWLEFRYDWRARRISKTVSNWTGATWVLTNDLRFVYDGWSLLAEVDGTETPVRSYTWGSDASGTMQGAGGVGGLLSMTLRSGTNADTYLYCYDGNWNVATLVEAVSGDHGADYDYGPFHELARANGPLSRANPILAAGKYHDWETGLYYYGYRYYSPSIGRWITRDPIEEGGGIHVNAFCLNAPVNLFDPLGESTETIRCAQVLMFEGGWVLGPWVLVAVVGGIAIYEAYDHRDDLYQLYRETCGACARAGTEVMRLVRVRRRSEKWTCTAHCYCQFYAPPPRPHLKVEATGYGPTESLAAQAAIDECKPRCPRGSYPRHCNKDRCWKD